MKTINPKGVAKFDTRGMIGTIYNGDYIHCYIHNIEALGLVVSEKIFFSFSHCKSMGAISCHGNHNFEYNLLQNLMQSIPQANNGSQ